MLAEDCDRDEDKDEDEDSVNNNDWTMRRTRTRMRMSMKMTCLVLLGPSVQDARCFFLKTNIFHLFLTKSEDLCIVVI